MKVCEYCGKEYEPSKFARKRQRFCTKQCLAKWEYENPKHKPCICLNCGKEYRPKSKERNKYCSRECSFEHKRAKPKERVFLVCVICGKKFEGRKDRKYCGDGCKKEIARRKERERNERKHAETIKLLICKECGKEFTPEYGLKKRMYCSDGCSRKHMKQQQRKTEAYKAQKKKDNRVRRARLKGAKVERFNEADIYDRDNWTCQICGKKVSKKLKYPHPMSASLDHVIALANGGNDEPANVQLAHFICNSYKGDRDAGQQLRLFG